MEAGQPPSYCVVNSFQTCLLAVSWWGGGDTRFRPEKNPSERSKKCRGEEMKLLQYYTVQERERGRECGDLESRSTLKEE